MPTGCGAGDDHDEEDRGVIADEVGCRGPVCSLRSSRHDHNSRKRPQVDWSVIGAVGEIVGAAAVVFSLVYVGRQVRLGNALARAEAYRVVSLRTSELLGAWAGDERFLPTVRVGLLERTARLADLPPDDQTRTILHFASAIRIFETIHRQVEAGMLGPEAYDMLGGVMFRAPIFQDAWERLRGAFAPDLAKLVEEKFDVRGHLE